MNPDERLAEDLVRAAIEQIGVFPRLAARAAADDRIAWTESALSACIGYVEMSTAKEPAGALWSQFLKHGKLPPALAVVPEVEPICPWCKEPLAVCYGLHGWAAAFRPNAEQQERAG